jgi:hypothetical protein
MTALSTRPAVTIEPAAPQSLADVRPFVLALGRNLDEAECENPVVQDAAIAFLGWLVETSKANDFHKSLYVRALGLRFGQQVGLTTRQTVCAMRDYRTYLLGEIARKAQSAQNVRRGAEAEAVAQYRAATAVDTRAVSPANGPVEPTVANAYYCVDLLDGDRPVVLRFETVGAWANKPAGWQQVAFQCGADNESDYRGFAFVAGSALMVWGKFKHESRIANAARVVLGTADPVRFAQAYAAATGKCGYCGRMLTTAASRYHGYGPVCADHHELPWGDPPADWLDPNTTVAGDNADLDDGDELFPGA